MLSLTFDLSTDIKFITPIIVCYNYFWSSNEFFNEILDRLGESETVEGACRVAFVWLNTCLEDFLVSDNRCLVEILFAAIRGVKEEGPFCKEVVRRIEKVEKKIAEREKWGVDEDEFKMNKLDFFKVGEPKKVKKAAQTIFQTKSIEMVTNHFFAWCYELQRRISVTEIAASPLAARKNQNGPNLAGFFFFFFFFELLFFTLLFLKYEQPLSCGSFSFLLLSLTFEVSLPLQISYPFPLGASNLLNDVACWVAISILSNTCVEERSKILCYFITLMEESVKKENYFLGLGVCFGLREVYVERFGILLLLSLLFYYSSFDFFFLHYFPLFSPSSLLSLFLSRLKDTWSLVPPDRLSAFESAKELFGSTKNFASLRNALAKGTSSPACSLCFTYYYFIFSFPELNSYLFFLTVYLGVALRDLIYLHDSNPSYVGENQRLINVLKVFILLLFIFLFFFFFFIFFILFLFSLSHS